ncbi:MAG: hypothetical protein ABIT08_13575 [Bacteroidia bacterium]
MTNLQIKNSVLNKIQALNNPYLLEEVYRLLEMETEDIEPLKLSPAQKEAIKEGQQDIAKGNKLSDKQADDEIDQWLKK